MNSKSMKHWIRLSERIVPGKEADENQATDLHAEIRQEVNGGIGITLNIFVHHHDGVVYFDDALRCADVYEKGRFHPVIWRWERKSRWSSF